MRIELLLRTENTRDYLIDLERNIYRDKPLKVRFENYNGTWVYNPRKFTMIPFQNALISAEELGIVYEKLKWLNDRKAT